MQANRYRLDHPGERPSTDNYRSRSRELGRGFGAWLAVAEMTHRVANEYAAAVSSLSLAAARSGHPAVTAAISMASRRLQAYAEANRSLQTPLAPGPIDLSEHLRRICEAVIQARLSEKGIALRLIEREIDLEADQCWRVGLIVSELITNAARHAFGDEGGAIVVELAERNGMILCAVTDNGRPPANPQPGQGALIVDALAAELEGTIERRFTPRGTLALLSFPGGGASPAAGQVASVPEASESRLFG